MRNVNSRVVVFVLLFILNAAQARADCVINCISAAGCGAGGTSGANACTMTTADCYSRCKDEKPRVSYGAIAYDKKSGAYGYSHGFDDQEHGENEAMRNCAQHGDGCESIVWFYNNCAAVAADGDSVTYAINSNAKRASDEAMEKCEAEGGKQCEVKISHCSR